MLINYVSENGRGESIVVSGTVSVPKGPAPEGGWPVISWAHGTTGYADVCAPTLGVGGMAADDYLKEMNHFVDTWVAKGYVVVRTNYEGLGAAGGHPYMNGPSAANTVIDIVRAARGLDSSIGTDWVVMGHSQGGHAALFTADRASSRAAELNLLGAVSIAPGGAEISQTIEYFRAGKPATKALQPYLALIMLGARAAEPSLDVSSLLSESAQPLLSVARSGCPWATGSTADTVPTSELFAPDAEFAPLIDYLNAQEPRNADPSVPTMIIAGAEDKQVTEDRVDDLVKHYCEGDSTIRYEVYDGLNHSELLTDKAPRQDAASFITKVMTEEQVPGNCPT